MAKIREALSFPLAASEPILITVSGKRILSRLAPIMALAMAAFAIWIFVKALHRYDPAEVLHRFGEIPAHHIAAAFACVLASYMIQTGYDFLALASLGRGASAPKAAFAAFIANAFTNNIGLSLLTGPSVRFRFYSAWGYNPLQIAEVVAMTKLAFFNGLLAAVGLAQILDPADLPARLHAWVSPRALGFALLLPAAATLIWNGLAHGRTMRLGRLRMDRPPQTILALQLLAACMHLVFSAFTLYYLLPHDALAAAGFRNPFGFLSAFLAIKFASMFIPIPGNLGVFEGAAVAVLTPALPDYPLLGGLLAYRLLYYFVPFALALLLLLAYELGAERGAVSGWRRRRRAAA